MSLQEVLLSERVLWWKTSRLHLLSCSEISGGLRCIMGKFGEGKQEVKVATVLIASERRPALHTINLKLGANSIQLRCFVNTPCRGLISPSCFNAFNPPLTRQPAVMVPRVSK